MAKIVSKKLTDYIDNHLTTFVINQTFGKNWAFYNADCIYGLSGLPDECIDFSIYSPPFAKLYIYSDSVADMGNSNDEAEFFEGFRFTLRELFRTTKTNGHQAIHCKDLMRYMSSHGYSGQYDFPGEIIRCAELEGWTFQCWITIWKNPVVEMQRTKTYGLLHKSFRERAEAVRQGAPDVVLILRKQEDQGQYNEDEPMPTLPEMVKERIKHIWSITAKTELERYKIINTILINRKMKDCNLSEIEKLDISDYLKDHLLNIRDNGVEDEDKLLISSLPLSEYTPELVNYWSKYVHHGRLCFIHCKPLPRYHNGEVVGYFDMMGEIIRRFERQGNWKFHTRIALADGTYLVGFRNWTDELQKNYRELNGQVVHNLKAPKTNLFYDKDISPLEDIEVTKRIYLGDGLEHSHYVGNNPPANWHDDGYYSILVWQKYASPVWFDLDGLPESHKNAWMDIDQTNVLNFKAAKDDNDQKHICPLQLDLSTKLILEYSKPGDVICSPYGGISSEGYTAIKLDRKAVLFELKSSYWQQGVKYLKEIEKQSEQMAMELA